MTGNGKDNHAARLEEAIRLKRARARPSASTIERRPRSAPPLLGQMQRSLWLLHQMDPASPAYNLASAFRLSSEPDRGALARALNEVVARHRLLRSSFREVGDTVQQIIHPHEALDVEVADATANEMEAVAVREARRPFALDAAPLLRMLLIRDRGGREPLLLLVMHHILADERSLEIFWAELAAAYAGVGASAHSIRPQFDDYTHWTSARAGRDRGDDVDYWRQRLQPAPDELLLPFEGSEGTATRPRGRLSRRPLDAALRDDVRRIAAATGTTPFMVFACAFRLLLQRYTDGRDIAFGTPVSTRAHPETAEMIGYFLNPVVIRTAVDETLPVEDALRQFADEVRNAFSHSSLPFDVLTEELAPPRRRGRHPFFQAMFVYQEAGPPPALGDIHMRPVELDLGESKLDLTLFVRERPRALELAVEYRTDRFADVWMQRLLGHFGTLVGGMVRDPERAVADVPMLPPEEHHQVTTEWQGGMLEADTAALLPEQILEQARQAPETAAVVCGGEHLSYGELERRGRTIAVALAAHGVRPGDRVALFVDRSGAMIAGLLGIQWAGGAYVPLDPAYPKKRNADVVTDAASAAVVTTSALRSDLPATDRPVICIDELETNDGGAGFADRFPSRADPDSPAYVLYTSGSTGRPKGVVVTHDNLRASTLARRSVYDTPPKRFLLLPSIAFDSSVAGIFWTLATGGTLVVPTEEEVRDARRLARLMAAERVTTLLCVPSLYGHLLRLGEGLRGGLETAIVAGESCSSELVAEHFRRLPQTRLFNEYGPTEATVWATVHEVSEPDTQRPVAIGRPIPGVAVHVLDDLGRTVPAGIPGQAWIAGATVARGYQGRDDLTEERFVVDRASPGRRMYRTGDRVKWTVDGRLLFLGRDDEQVKLRGFRIEPGEIEAVLTGHPEVEEAAVVVRGSDVDDTDPDGPAHLVAFLRANREDGGAAWRAHLGQQLPDFMVPHRYVVLPELPRLPNGKTDRARLRALPLQEPVPAGGEAAPEGERERALVSLWEALIGRSGIGIDDNFFELGGHSLLVVEMAHAIESDFGVPLTPAEVFQSPTIRELADRIDRRRGTDAPAFHHLFPIQPGGREAPLIVAVPHFFSEMLATRFRGERPVYGLRGVSLRPEGNLGRWRTMGELAEELVDEVCRRFPSQSLFVAGYSFGASMAFAATRVMEQRDIPVRGLYLIAPMPLDIYRLGPLQLQIDGLERPAADLSAAEALVRLARNNNPFTPRPYRNLRQLLVTRPRRRLLSAVGKLRKRLGLPLGVSILHADVRVERFRLHRGYVPQPVRTPTVIFNAREPDTDAAATWRPCFRGPLEVIETPDPHLGAASLAQAKELILERFAVDLNSGGH
jgi:amino acid adenylation domain-containing protein